MSSGTDSVIARIVRVLEAFDTSEGLSASEIGRRADLPTPTAHRIARELAHQGILVRDNDLKYHVGLRLWELATRSSTELALREKALPYMEDVHSVLRCHMQLSVLQGIEIVYLERLATAKGAVNVTRLGGRMPAATTSAGVVLGAFADEEVQTAIAHSSLHQYTPKTPTEPHAILDAMAVARRQGYLVCEGWIHVESTGISVPIHNHWGDVQAALTAIVPVSSDLVVKAIPALLMASHGISRAMQSPRATKSMGTKALESFFRRNQHLRPRSAQIDDDGSQKP